MRGAPARLRYLRSVVQTCDRTRAADSRHLRWHRKQPAGKHQHKLNKETRSVLTRARRSERTHSELNNYKHTHTRPGLLLLRVHSHTELVSTWRQLRRPYSRLYHVYMCRVTYDNGAAPQYVLRGDKCAFIQRRVTNSGLHSHPAPCFFYMTRYTRGWKGLWEM